MLKTCILLLILNYVNATIDYMIPTDEMVLPQGKIMGRMSSRGDYRKFVGIPYATVSDRFQAPGDPPKWNDTLYANTDYPVCPQYIKIFPTPVVGDEDCLALNVFTPIVPQNEPLPVMVYIHGGGWYMGSNKEFIYDPRYLVKKNVIVVTFNYRLGALGFLCLGNAGAPGNAGLKDQLAALKWVKNNIQFFGGNPNMVTIFGSDAGSASVSYLLASPLAEGLFNRVIAQSGPALVPMAFDNNPIKSASSLAADLGFNSTDPDELLDFYKHIPLRDLITASHRSTQNNAFALYVFRPCQEAQTEGAIVTARPVDLLKSMKPNPNIEYITGFNNKDGIILASKYNYTGYQDILKHFEQVIPENLYFPREDDKTQFIKDVKNIYFDGDDIGYSSKLVTYMSEAFIIYPNVATAKLVLNAKATVYNYYFTHDSIRNIGKILDGAAEETGAGHGDELFYMFEPAPLQLLPPLPADAKVIYEMTMMWARFAHTGNPSIPKNLPWAIEWPANKLGEEMNLLQIGDDLKIVSMPNNERMKFWERTYKKYGSY